MDSGFQLYGILIFAVVAGVLLIRLWSVLGRRTGTERRIDPFAPPAPKAPVANSPFAPAAKPGPILEGRAVRLDPNFDQQAFLAGARNAFTLIVNAFAAGDTEALRPLLSPDVFEQFASAIRARPKGGEKQPDTLVSLKSAGIDHQATEGSTSLVTVKFVSDQNTGGGGAVQEHVDFWTFSRPAQSRDPNWILVATKGPEAA
jgi:predicted lipid-binding transport protein (Tim44 family)